MTTETQTSGADECGWEPVESLPPLLLFYPRKSEIADYLRTHVPFPGMCIPVSDPANALLEAKR